MKRLHRLPQQNNHLNRIKILSQLLDNAITIPGTNYKIGLDPVIGLIPVVGDTASSLVSLYIVYLAARAGLSPMAVGRMIGNIVIDGTVSVVPVIGDLFDFAWKANAKNLEIVQRELSLEKELAPRTARHLSGWLLAFLLIILGIVLIFLFAVAVIIFRALF